MSSKYLPDLIHDSVQYFFPDGVVTAGEIVSSILLPAGAEAVRGKKCTYGTPCPCYSAYV